MGTYIYCRQCGRSLHQVETYPPDAFCTPDCRQVFEDIKELTMKGDENVSH
jgi:hypothetical protein